MKVIILFVILLTYSKCIQYIYPETKTKLPSEKGYFFIKSSDYSNSNYIYIHFKETNIMLDSLEFCDYDKVPPDNFTSNDCKFETIYPYKSKSESDTIYNEYYQFLKYTRNRNFIIFQYGGNTQSNFLIEVECLNSESGDNNGDNGDKLYIALIIIAIIIVLCAIIGTTFFVIYSRKKNNSDGEQIIPNQNESCPATAGQDSLLNK